MNKPQLNKNLRSPLIPFKRKNISWEIHAAEKDRIIHLVKSTLNELELTPFTTIETYFRLTKGWKHRYYSVCLNKNNQKVFFHALTRYNDLSINSFKKELLFEKYINKKSNTLRDYVPRMIAYSNTSENLWLITEYFPFEPLEKVKNVHDHVNITDLAKIIHTINFYPIELFKDNIVLEKFDLDKKFMEISQKVIINKDIGEFIVSEDLFKLQEYLTRYKDYILNHTKSLNHGDMHLANIISNKKIIKILDWESYHLNNYAYDMSFFIVEVLNQSKLKKELLREYLKLLSEEEKENYMKLLYVDILMTGLPRMIYPRFNHSKQEEFVHKKYLARLMVESTLRKKDLFELI
ncbi:MAG: hypothetical protein Q7S61_04930 [bacterium]|nr:hypothetical protein [bacterium]